MTSSASFDFGRVDLDVAGDAADDAARSSSDRRCRAALPTTTSTAPREDDAADDEGLEPAGEQVAESDQCQDADEREGTRHGLNAPSRRRGRPVRSCWRRTRSASLPSASRTTALACDITLASWVEKMKVVPLGPVQLLHQVDDVLAGHRVEVGGGLVGEHELRAGDQRARDGDALALAAGQLVGPVLLIGRSPTRSSSGAIRSLRSRRGELALQQQRQLDVLEDAQHRDQVEALEDEADGVQPQVGQLPLGQTVGVLALPPRTVPEVGVSTQPMRFSSVVLPLPDGPAIEMNSPWSPRGSRRAARERPPCRAGSL